MNKYLFTILEWIGTFCILTAYFITTNGNKINQNIIAGMNLYGGIILTISCYLKKNWSVLAIQLVWAIIAIYHLFKINL